MGFVSALRGIASGKRYDPDALMNLDPVDGRPLYLELDLERLAADRPGQSWFRSERPSLWRYGGLLALDPDDAEDAKHVVSLGEGFTPLLPASDNDLARRVGFELHLKDEGRAYPGFGANPSGSFKDRGMTMVVSMARRFGLQRLAVPTQGNAGDSLVHYARAAGLEVVVAMPDDTPLPIRGSVAAAAFSDPRVHLELVQGTIREAGALLRERYLDRGWFNCATFQEPGWRIEGKKTLGLELAEQLAGGPGCWALPEVIVYPTGGGTGILGMWKAFDELEALGLVGPERPRMICVQSRETAPLVRAFEAGEHDTESAEAGSTLAVGLNVPGGVGHFEVLRIIRESGGAAVAVSEEQLAASLTDSWQRTDWWLGPEGAACLAALPRLVDEELIRPRDRVVVVNTGSVEKYLPDLRHLLQG